MKRLWVPLMLVAMVAAACAPAAPLSPSPRPPTHIPVDLTPAQRAALQALATKLAISVDQIHLVSTEAVDWPDACLGVVRPGIMCIQVITPGFRIVLEANGQSYAIHTNQDGTAVVEAVSPLAGDAATLAARQALARALGISDAEISVVSSAAIQWPDSCLGVARPGLACAQMVTPGSLIVLEVQGQQYEYHTDADGSVVLPATIALTWHRSGGFAGFCDDLTVFSAGEVAAASCKSGAALEGQLTADERDQLKAWLTQFGSVQIVNKDKAVADAMAVSLSLFGSGSAQPTDDEKQALVSWAQTVYGRIRP